MLQFLIFRVQLNFFSLSGIDDEGELPTRAIRNVQQDFS